MRTRTTNLNQARRWCSQSKLETQHFHLSWESNIIFPLIDLSLQIFLLQLIQMKGAFLKHRISWAQGSEEKRWCLYSVSIKGEVSLLMGQSTVSGIFASVNTAIQQTYHEPQIRQICNGWRCLWECRIIMSAPGSPIIPVRKLTLVDRLLLFSRCFIDSILNT